MTRKSPGSSVQDLNHSLTVWLVFLNPILVQLWGAPLRACGREAEGTPLTVSMASFSLGDAVWSGSESRTTYLEPLLYFIVYRNLGSSLAKTPYSRSPAFEGPSPALSIR